MKKSTFRILSLTFAIAAFAVMMTACSNSANHDSQNDKKPEAEKVLDIPKTSVSTEDNREIKKIQVVDFSATWCGPCQQLAPYFEKWANTYKDYATFEKIDIDQNQMEAEENEIEAIPTVIIRDSEGNEIQRIVGFEPEEMEQAIKSAIEDNQQN